MKKTYITIIALILLFTMTGCGGNNQSGPQTDRLKIVTTIFPAYDWVRNILGENADKAELTLLCDKGIDIHSFQPSADDIIKISGCDIFIYVGGESEGWVEDALKASVNDKMSVINLMTLLGDSVKEEELIEGMQAVEKEDEESEAPEYDEHVWLSVRNAIVFCNGICKAISGQQSSLTESCERNTEAYIKELQSLDSSFSEAVQNSEIDTLIFGDRFPFRYFTDDYGLKYYAAFIGCSAESEASFETISFLADKLKNSDIKSVITLEKSDDRLADTIIKASGRSDVSIIKLDSMQTITAQAINDGASYLKIMQDNLENLKAALAK